MDDPDGIVLIVSAFGWNGGKLLLQQPYDQAKTKAAEQKAEREAKKAAKRRLAAEPPGGSPSTGA